MQRKVGCGVSHFKYDEHPEYTGTMCFFIVRTDGTSEDFSFRKCLDIVFSGHNPDKNQEMDAIEATSGNTAAEPE